MQWTGKLLGGAIGLVLGPVGAAVGAAIGHQYDRFASGFGSGRASILEIGQQFFRATFLVMGNVAKSDGRVSERDIEAARATMASLRLTEAQTRQAIEHFTTGKQADFDVVETLQSLRRACGGHPDIIRTFLEIQLRAALAGNDAAASGLGGAPRASLARVAAILGVSQPQLAQLEALLRQYSRRGPGAAIPNAQERLAGAYRLLEVEPAATDAQVTKAYRRLMSRHHPDKLKAHGLPDSMLEPAKQRTQQIREAYELVRERRGSA